MPGASTRVSQHMSAPLRGLMARKRRCCSTEHCRTRARPHASRFSPNGSVRVFEVSFVPPLFHLFCNSSCIISFTFAGDEGQEAQVLQHGALPHQGQREAAICQVAERGQALGAQVAAAGGHDHHAALVAPLCSKGSDSLHWGQAAGASMFVS